MNQLVAWLEPVLEYFRELPFLVLVLAALPLVAIAWFSRSYPSRALVLLLVPACAASRGSACMTACPVPSCSVCRANSTPAPAHAASTRSAW